MRPERRYDSAMRRTSHTWVLASALGFSACSFQANGVAGDGAPGVDGNRDGAPLVDGRPIDGGPCGGAALTFSPRHFDKCAVSLVKLSTLGGDAITINTTTKTIDRGNGTGPEALPEATVVAQVNGPELLLVASNNLTITANQVVTVVGSRSIVFVDTATLTIDGKIVAAAIGAIGGAGADGNSCGSITNSGNGGLTVIAAAGAGGGGFGAPMADPNMERSGAKGGGGMGFAGAQGGKFFAASASLAKLRGGCAGGTGINSAKGAGGGTIALVANTVQVNSGGVLAVPGSGGGAAASSITGAGGGGSGGAIWIEGASVRVSGTCTANGGGGGAGHKGADGGAGADGAQDTDVLADGGVAQNGGPAGGKGAAGTTKAEAGKNPGGGETAGGGGGGPGVIRVKAHVGSPRFDNSLFSPPLTTTQ